MELNEETIRLVQEAEKQRLFAQKVQQQNTTLTSQLELYKERNRILEGINKDNNYLNEFLEADERAKRYNKQAQSQLVRDRDIIRDLKKQRDKLELDVKDHKRQKEEYQKTQTIFNQTQCNKEEKYLDDILQLQAKIKDFENVVCKMGKSTETLRLLTNEQKAFRDNLRKSGLGYNGPYVLSQVYTKIPKLYNAYELCNKSEQLHVFDSEETLEDAEKSQLKMNEFQKDEKVQALKIKPIDYGKLNKLYDDFVPQKELSAEQTYFSSSCISSVSKIYSEEFSSKTKQSMESMPSVNQILGDLNEMENIFKKLNELLEKNSKWILQDLHSYLEIFQTRFIRDVKEMKDVFDSVENDLDETFKQNEFLKDRLLEASLAEDIKNLVITSCVKIRNKYLHDEIERISKESKDVSNESKTVDTVCNDAFEVTQELSKRIVELEKDLSKSEAKSISFEIALQHKSRENNSLKTTYKDLFESVQMSKVETKQCDEVKVKNDFDAIETKNIEFEYRVASLIKENEHLKLTYKNLFDSIKKSRFDNILGKIEFFKKKQLDISDLNKGSGKNICNNAKCELQTKFVELEKVLTQQTKAFDDVKLELSNKTAKFEAYFEKLEKTKAVLERQLARKVDDSKAEKDQFLKEINHLRTQLVSKPVTAQSLPKNEKDQFLKRIAYLESKLASQDIRSCQKEYHELRTSYNALKVNFDSLNRERRETNVSKSSKPKVSVSEKVHTGESTKLVSRRVSQFTT
ncbi:hypothetical protein Tco_1104371 [Tanacetum coccineum]